MTSQLLYGESAEILDKIGSFCKIRTGFDDFEGWVDAKHLTQISEDDFKIRKTNITTKPFGIYDLPEGRSLLSIGSEVALSIEPLPFTNVSEGITKLAQQFLNVPFLWGGRSFFGIDGAGFSQIIYKIFGMKLPRNPEKQAEIGKVLDFIEESNPGDLAFFEDEDGKINHVGILLSPGKIIHVYGKVRIDDLDYSGIFNKDLNKHTHKLRFVKTLFL